MKSTHRSRLALIAATIGATCFGQAVVAENLGDFFLLDGGHVLGFAHLASPLGLVVFGIGPGGEIPTEPHGDRTGRDLGQAGRDDDGRRIDRAGQAGGQGEGDRQTVGHADHDVTHRFGRREVTLDVG